MSLSTANEEPQYTYLRFELVTRDLDDECRERLEQLGVECVQEGGCFEAYGIIEASMSVVEDAQQDPAISSVKVGAPPCGF